MRDEFAPSSDSPAGGPRDLIGPLARRRKTAVLTFAAVLAVAAVGAWFAPPEYVSEMTLVVRRERVDTIVTADPTAPQSGSEVSENELLSEAEILRSRELLEQVVLDTGLHVPTRYGDSQTESRARAAAITRLERALDVTPIRRTTLIQVRYTDRDPRMAHLVLERLSDRYLDKHLAVHRAAGTQEFFGEQVARSREALEQAQVTLTAFGRREQVVAPEQERTAVMQQLVTFQAALQQARTDAAETARRLAAVESGLNATPTRQVTAVRTGANGALIGQLKARVLEMELEREALLAKFTEQYPAVVQLDKQLQHTREALAGAERAPILDETSDQNPTYQWLRSEEARLRTERAAVEARITALSGSIREYRQRAQRLDAQAVEQDDLQRSVAAAKESFVLYQRKAEEARISDALDRTRIANVGMVDPPTRPVSDAGTRRALILWLGIIGALIAGIGGAYAVDGMRPVLHTSRDVQGALNVPVLATVRSSIE